jgi:hypothetical protein
MPTEVQEYTFSPEIHKLTMLCVQTLYCDEAGGIQSSAISIRTLITLGAGIAKSV